jgi:hypothetical protein
MQIEPLRRKLRDNIRLGSQRYYKSIFRHLFMEKGDAVCEDEVAQS